MRITGLRLTPVAVADPPLRNSWGVHAPYALRIIVELETDEGVVGLSEGPGGAAFLGELAAAGPTIRGEDPWHLERIRLKLRDRPRAFSILEVACLDACARSIGRPLYDLLGGLVRPRVPFASYLFFKYAGANDPWGEVGTPDEMVGLARRFHEGFGFTTIKVKGGVLPPEAEIETMRLLRQEFPTHKLRIDPNAIWSVETSLHVARALADCDLEYLEDPTWGLAGMAAVARHTAIPLSTNMAVTNFDEIPVAVEMRAAQVILCDHHFWGGLTGCKRLAGLCESFALGLSMHSNNHLGISMAAMTHLAATTPLLIYACDTHYPWQTEDVIAGGKLQFKDGCLEPPTGAGLGVTLDGDRLAALHENYERGNWRSRDDTAEMVRRDPFYLPFRPRW
ncbi:MAG: enolase C-terminal domain-like protein [Anaerolineae bacterium]